MRATLAGTARSTNGRDSAPATAGPISLPPAPYEADSVTTPTAGKHGRPDGVGVPYRVSRLLKARASGRPA